MFDYVYSKIITFFLDSPFDCSQVVYEYSYVTNLKEVYGTDPSAYAITNSDDRPEVDNRDGPDIRPKYGILNLVSGSILTFFIKHI